MFRHIVTGKFLEKGIKNYENKPEIIQFLRSKCDTASSSFNQ